MSSTTTCPMCNIDIEKRGENNLCYCRKCDLFFYDHDINFNNNN